MDAMNMIGEMLGKELHAQTESAQSTRDAQEQARSQTQQIIEGMINGSGQKNPSLADPRIQGIVNALAAQPFLIDSVDRYLKNLVVKINKAIQGAIRETEEQHSVPVSENAEP